jgi:N-acetylglucosaminyldiphosphoundecaprenol N-acetyl-beta-D-mannosaminyltransferase
MSSKFFMNDDEKRFSLGGALIHNISFADAVERILKMAREDKASYVVTPNTDHIVQLQKNTLLQRIYVEADLVVADGMPIVWASYLLGEPLKAKVSGSDLMPELCRRAAEDGLKIFLMGAAPGVARCAADTLTAMYPSLNIVGVESPPVGFDKDETQNRSYVDLIKKSRADIVFVGLGAPKQEIWIYRNHMAVGHGVMLGVGASIDFIAGHIKRAPKFMQKTGTEWIYRLGQEPLRLWRRYLGDFVFVGIVFKSLRLSRLFHKS